MRLDRSAYEGRLASTPPAEKLAVAASGLLLALVLPPWPYALCNLLTAVLAGLVWARFRPAMFLGWAALPLGFLVPGSLALAISLRPDYPWLEMTEEGWRQAGLVSLRAGAASLWLIWLATTTPVTQLATLLGRVPGFGTLSEVMLLIYRQLVLLVETAIAMQAAQSARLGYGNPKSALKSLGSLSAGLLPRALARAGRMEMGLSARNLDGGMLPCPSLPKASPVFLAQIGFTDVLILAAWGLS